MKTHINTVFLFALALVPFLITTSYADISYSYTDISYSYIDISYKYPMLNSFKLTPGINNIDTIVGEHWVPNYYGSYYGLVISPNGGGYTNMPEEQFRCNILSNINDAKKFVGEAGNAFILKGVNYTFLNSLCALPFNSSAEGINNEGMIVGLFRDASDRLYGHEANANSNDTPIPAAIYLFGSGLMGLFVFRRREKE